MKMVKASLRLLVLFIVMNGPVPAIAVQPSEILPDAAQEARARSLSGLLRCMVCQNQSIDDSDADLAKDIRVIVRTKIQAGQSDQAILDFLVARYGDFILLKPAFKAETLLLWLSPVLALAIGLFAVWRSTRAYQDALQESSLSEEEKLALATILKPSGPPSSVQD